MTRGHSGRRVLHGAGVLACAAVLAVAGCGTPKGADVKMMSEADVIRQVHRYAEQVTALIGDTSLTNPAESSAPCDGKDGDESEQVFYVQGAYQVPVPADQHLAVLAKVREQWKQQGYTIKEDRTFPDGKTGVLAAKAPSDGYSVSLESTTPPQAFALLVHSACFRSPTPR